MKKTDTMAQSAPQSGAVASQPALSPQNGQSDSQPALSPQNVQPAVNEPPSGSTASQPGQEAVAVAPQGSLGDRPHGAVAETDGLPHLNGASATAGPRRGSIFDLARMA